MKSTLKIRFYLITEILTLEWKQKKRINPIALLFSLFIWFKMHVLKNEVMHNTVSGKLKNITTVIKIWLLWWLLFNFMIYFILLVYNIGLNAGFSVTCVIS